MAEPLNAAKGVAMPSMRKMMGVAVAAIMISGLGATAAQAAKPGAAPGQGKILCFADAPGICTLNTSGAKGSATLDTTAGGVAGAYIPGYNNSFYGVRVSQVGALSFTYTGPGAVDPHQSIPIDSDHDGYTNYFASVPAGTCNNGAGLVDVINDATCTIYRNDDSSVSYANWAEFVAAIGTNNWIALNDYFTFVIADSTPASTDNVWTVSNLTVGKPGK